MNDIHPSFKYAGWCDIHSSKLLDEFMYPDDWTGYGPMDAFYILLLGKLRRTINKKDFECKQYFLKNVIAQSGSQFDISRPVYEERLVRKKNTSHLYQRKRLHTSIVHTIQRIYEDKIKEKGWNVSENNENIWDIQLKRERNNLKSYLENDELDSSLIRKYKEIIL